MASKKQELVVEVTTKADQAKRDLAELDKTARAVEGKPIEIPIDVKGTEDVKAKLNTTEQAAGGARNAFANLVGNTAQDLGGLAGNLGSVGVAIGQVAEYTADATDKGGGLTSALAGAASMAGPMLALAAAGIAVNKIVGDMSKKSQEAKEANEAFADSLQQGAGSLETWGKSLDDAFGAGATDQVQDLNKFLKDTLDKTGDLEKTASAFGYMGLTLDDLGSSLSAADQDFRAWGENLLQQRGFSKQAAEDFTLLVAENEKLGDAIDATSTKQIKNIVPPGEVGNLEDLTRGMSQVLDVVEKLNTEDAAKSFTEAARAIPGMSDAVDKAAAAGGSELDIALRVNDALAEQARVREEGARAAEESGTILDQVGLEVEEAATLAATAADKAREAQDRWLGGLVTYPAAIDNLTESVLKLTEQTAKQIEKGDEGAASYDGNSKAALANRDAMRDVYAAAKDVIDAYAETGATSEQVAAKTIEQANAAYQLAKDNGLSEEAAAKLRDTILTVPTSRTTEMEYRENNYDTMLDHRDKLADDIETDVYFNGILDRNILNAINNLPPGSIPGTRGAVAPQGVGVAVVPMTAPAAPAAATTATRAATINVNLSGAIVADTFQLQRVVSRAVRQGNRLNGTRRY